MSEEQRGTIDRTMTYTYPCTFEFIWALYELIQTYRSSSSESMTLLRRGFRFVVRAREEVT